MSESKSTTDAPDLGAWLADVAKLAATSKFEYHRVRKAKAKEYEIPVGILDDAVEKARGPGSAGRTRKVNGHSHGAAKAKATDDGAEPKTGNPSPDSAAVAKLPPRYTMDESGLLYTPHPKANTDPEPVSVSAPFEVVCETDDGDGHAQGVVLQWRDRQGRLHQRVLPRSACDPKSPIATELMDEGLVISPPALNLFRSFLGMVTSANWRKTVTRTGWHEVEGKPCFVLTNTEAFGPAKDHVIAHSSLVGSVSLYASKGTLLEWQEAIAKKAIGNSRMGLFLSVAFTGPLLDIMNERSSGVHYYGKSHSGKSTALNCASSVWGSGAPKGGFVCTWRATSNGMEGIACAHHGTLIPLDEIGMATCRDCGEVVYSLGNESGKARAERDGSARKTQTWQAPFLSTGETSLADKIGENGSEKVFAGQEVRMPSIPADAGVGLGLFQDLHNAETAAVFASALTKASETYFGTAGRAFLAKLTEELWRDPAALRAKIQEGVDGFVRKYLPPGADGQVTGVANRFGLFAAAGELAMAYDVLPWPVYGDSDDDPDKYTEAEAAVGACFRAWLAARGGSKSAEEIQAIARVRLFIEQHGSSRFAVITDDGGGKKPTIAVERTIINRAGWKKKDGENDSEGWLYLFTPEVWRAEVCKGMDQKLVASELESQGYLVREGKHMGKLHRIPDEGRLRLITIRSSIQKELEDEKALALAASAKAKEEAGQ